MQKKEKKKRPNDRPTESLKNFLRIVCQFKFNFGWFIIFDRLSCFFRVHRIDSEMKQTATTTTINKGMKKKRYERMNELLFVKWINPNVKKKPQKKRFSIVWFLVIYSRYWWKSTATSIRYHWHDLSHFRFFFYLRNNITEHLSITGTS